MWADRRWQEEIQRLPPAQQFILVNSLRELLQALKGCRDPRRDQELRPWLPSRWDPPRLQATHGDWIEYRLGDDENRGRAVICHDRDEDVIYLVAKTAIHDHAALRELVARFAR